MRILTEKRDVIGNFRRKSFKIFNTKLTFRECNTVNNIMFCILQKKKSKNLHFNISTFPNGEMSSKK